MAKFKAPKPGKPNAKFSPPSIDKEGSHKELVKFSFKYLTVDNPAYSFNKKDSAYFIKFLERVSLVCKMKCSELQYPTLKALRNHYIKWEDTTQTSFGLPAEEQLVDKPFQFGISANEHGRVVGFFIGSTFFIVWFDPDHNTYA